MSNSFSVWLDDETAEALQKLAKVQERKRGALIRILIRHAAREAGLINSEQRLRNTYKTNMLDGQIAGE